MPDTDLENLRAILMGVGLTALPKLLQQFHAVRNAGKNLSEGRSHKDDGPSTADQTAAAAPEADPYRLQSVLAPLLQQMGGGNAPGGAQAMPVNSPGMRPGNPPAPLPRMPGLPRTMAAGASPAGF